MPTSRSAATAPSCCGRARFAHLLLVVIAAFFVLFFAWASWATLDEVTRGEGRVIPSSQVQVVQNLEGGIVSAILVREGEIVERGQVLLRIDNVRAASDLRENRKRYLALLGALARLRAEVDETGIAFRAAGPGRRRRGRAQRARRCSTRASRRWHRSSRSCAARPMQREQELAELQSRLAQLEARTSWRSRS